MSRPSIRERLVAEADERIVGNRKRPLAPRRYVVSGYSRLPLTVEVVARNAKEALAKARDGEWEGDYVHHNQVDHCFDRPEVERA